MSRELLVSDLRVWASVAWQRGSVDSATLIQEAAAHIENGRQDVGLAAEIMAYSCQAHSNGTETFSEVLMRAGDALTPRLTHAPDDVHGKAARPRSIVWDVVEKAQEADG